MVVGSREPQAVGKVLSDRLIRPENLEAALGSVWCPRNGVECKDLGENRFLFTFFQASGKHRALNEGPWMLLDFGGTRIIDEITFSHIPIWIRVMKMPLGMMNKWYGEAIGDQVGVFVEMENEEDGTTMGEFMRIKVRRDVRKPLMRGVTLWMEEDGGEKEIWCRLVYEYLPEFWYVCGIIGHMEKVCEKKEKGSVVHQYSPKMRFIPPRRRYGDFQKQSGRGGRLYGGGGHGGFGAGSSQSVMRSGSDTPSWRKEQRTPIGVKKGCALSLEVQGEEIK